MSAQETPASIADTAADWIARLDSGPLTDAENAALDEWLDSDSRHFGAFVRAEAVLASFDRARVLPMSAEDSAEPHRTRPSRRTFIAWAAAASMAASIAGVMLVQREPTAPVTRYASGAEPMRQLELADGSRLKLGPQTEISVRLASRERRIDLVRGAAFFDVAPDPARPFTVSYHNVAVTAVGTSFSVEQASAGEARVLVRHGRVTIAPGRGQPPIYANAGDRATWTIARPETIAMMRLNVEELHRELAWTEGMLVFEGQTIEEAAAAFGRYGSFRILIPEKRLARRKVSGWFAASDPRGFAVAAAASLGATVEHQRDGVIIRPAP